MQDKDIAKNRRDTDEEPSIVTDEGGNIESINRKALRLLGLNHKNRTPQSISDLIPNINIDSIDQLTIIPQHGTDLEKRSGPLYVKKTEFVLHQKKYSLLTLHMSSPKHEMELESVLNELLDMKYALDESNIVAITDQTGKIKYVNDKFCEISQYSRSELIGKDHRIINSGYHDKAFMRNLWRTIANGRVWHGDIKNRAKDGSYYWVDTTIVPFLNNDGKPHRYLAIRKEITDYKRVVEELKKSLQELVDLKFALDESSIVAITDRRGKITYVNDKFIDVSKYSREELLGNTHAIINSGYHSREFFKDLWRTIGTGNVWQSEIKNKAKDGTFYWVDTTIVPFLDEKGKPYQYLSIRFEITKRKRIEEELKHTMTRIINVQEEERKRFSRELHDGIGQNLYSHLITINRISSEVDHPLVDQMLSEASEIIQEVRDFSWELRPSVLDDLGLVPAIRTFLNRYSEFYGIDVYFDCYLKTRLDSNIEITIYRIIQESLTNVRKYAEVDQASITVRETEEGVRVVIEDHGKGFSREKLSSSGVGLFSMEERARSVNGQLSIVSGPGKGTTVILEI
ncbi:PAS domain-containing sensor histidine kinase [Aquibacillus salsiterrae]|uniref:histidine kinase n=1 Tax=Aquibacillus salsiterrae TaxID=2950439 RepID=A0A9X3WFS5_9BACI|nr:PAS domain S-box protein [Aquibacillus salsiterrae]MDC3417858.1 PAS domain S-box protein [Aquibacillus salsiterrae]